MATCTRSSSLSRALLLPYLHSRTQTLCEPIRLARFSSTMKQPRPPSLFVRSQAKRGPFLKQDQVAATTGDLEFEAPLKIVEYPDPILRAKNKRIDSFDDNLKKLVDEMFDVMYKTDGIGLSAPQVGINVQLMVFNPADEHGEGDEIVLVNPRVNKYSKKTVLFNEGCLSFPGIYADVKRPESVKIDARDINGARFTVNLSGLPARVFQHEFDHLQGILFFDRMTEEVLDSIRPGLQALEKKYEDKTGFPSPERIETHRLKKVAAGFGKL
ncbi:hypothetical protein POPTR_001G346700v4 [Populus trichocarpa]|uniref:Peptide deformylase n=1 Tax=Populus trichocarpa TaxID=3694 RepID=U5GX87_POPTR|nr:peptide deformylase 1B, chloroplastic/mitochondrial isoform X1 [Populus trichocarpa]PNT58272.1 hypothetical protein POPTR_001G346700v4 [Populus trichocarpa]RQO85680.1 hypothetical protein POPTR_001G346700v4 [Populus trichocarpa]|eukprot:XP_006369928.1 peptide deformylase 1B, chloroplastic/mitochondrial isoform X1 [Populus trichocarpa]